MTYFEVYDIYDLHDPYDVHNVHELYDLYDPYDLYDLRVYRELSEVLQRVLFLPRLPFSDFQKYPGLIQFASTPLGECSAETLDPGL